MATVVLSLPLDETSVKIADGPPTDEPDDLWSTVLRRKGGAFAVLALMPPDPSRN